MYFDFSNGGYKMGTTCNHKQITDDHVFLSTLNKLNLNKNLVASTKQVHLDKIKYIKSAGFYKSYDGLITNIKHKLILVIKTADCVPIFIYDNNKGIYGLIHAGWKGVQKKIHMNAIERFLDLNSELNDICIVLGPSIKDCCFEIKEDVVQLFDNQFILNKNNSLYLNLNECIKSDLETMGVENIKINQICSFDNKRCHSFRRDGILSGRMYSFITY